MSEALLLDRLNDGDTEAFETLFERYQPAMIRIARAQVGSAALAEEAVQEAWIAVLKGHRAFARRSSLKTWLFRIVINRARTLGARERRQKDIQERDRFHPADHPLADTWAIPPRNWTPEEHLLTREMRSTIDTAIDELPALQRQVITLRDVYGWTAAEVCELFDINDSNQRILLHRARVHVRQAIEDASS